MAHERLTSAGSSLLAPSTQPRLLRGTRIEMGHLPERVYAGIGAAGTGEAHALCGDAAERLLGDLLHRTQRRLRLPAGIAAAVVFNPDGNPRHARWSPVIRQAVVRAHAAKVRAPTLL